MKRILFPSLLLFISMTACGPAAENRETMHARARVFQDSIARALKMAIAEADMPANTTVVVDTASHRASANSTQTVK